ncbi:hypothetical protein NLU13_0949 [Sarocladium strictum]|uniref:gamma-glutamylcyclotransferase n=1 Tax=Sarocladium strictum TaxID=5046 RepID=A0AA39GQ11_SARSR|nr:hypothetical protein NLU13_0949 [Sarocladium strictum]
MTAIVVREACCSAMTVLGKLTKIERTTSTPALSARPSIPETSVSRLAEASESTNSLDETEQPESNTVLYLAYGSNLCVETFLGVRGIRPLSQVNVSVPALQLSFDLPGIPYGEPCFANVDWRKIPKNPKVPPIPKLPPTPPIDPPKPPALDPLNPPRAQMQWNGELMGVVYEVTKEDYRHIIQTEGGGASYKEIIVPCIPIPPAIEIPEKPPLPELPRPFLARTLFAPYVPDERLPDDPRKDKWWFKYITPPHRPSKDYAQASDRYLKLIRDGAREHELPEEYQQYLHSLQPYTITTWRQRIGQFIFAGILVPLIMMFFKVGQYFADKNGNLPPVLMLLTAAIFNLSWRFYDVVLKHLFGDGERTEEKRDRSAYLHVWRAEPHRCDEEKAKLLIRSEDLEDTGHDTL